MVTVDRRQITVTLLVFSGRPNPEWALEDQAAAEFSQRVSQVVGKEPIHAPPGSGVGAYNGFIVRAPSAPTPPEFAVFYRVVSERAGPQGRHWRADCRRRAMAARRRQETGSRRHP